MGVDVKLQSETFLFFGLGYVARALLPSLLAKGFHVFATARTQDAAQACEALGVTPIRFNGAASRELKTVLKKTAYIMSSIAPNADGDPVINALGKNWVKRAPNLKWAGYLSATSVYGDRGGQWVFEEEFLYPTTSRGKYRVLAELDWCESGAPVHIFRLAGIYGPDRNAFKRVRADNAKAIIKEGHVSSRIHVDDIVSALLLSMENPNPLRIYNLADDTPCPPQDVLNYAAELLGITLPQMAFTDANMSPLARSFYNDLRRTSNERVKRELGWALKYPNYKEGLKAILKI
ncbi:MAG: NAD(P)-dependent oxidoreductase [Robiginitomaculum sp.]|nr:MAG: NAD(P)-dependent oxidoreductase [Robiginitomaculum sp.]